MFLCFIDESGFNGKLYDKKQPVQVMAGIFPNVYNYHKTDSEFQKVFHIIKREINIEELKAREIYGGRKSWREIDPLSRDEVIEFYINWIRNRKHKIIIVAIDNKKFFEKKEEQDEYASIFESPWVLGGFHIACVIQKQNRRMRSNKGRTILIFDEQKQFQDKLRDLIANPPNFVDEFVEFDEKKEKSRLNQIIDTAFFVKSHHSALAQVADIISFFFRKYLELNFYGVKEKYRNERSKINKWIKLIEDKFISFNKVFPSKRNKPYIRFLNEVKANGV